jgi:hypothetical protein
MARVSKAQQERDKVRARITELLADQDYWTRYEHIREWLEKLLRRPRNADFTPAERAAVSRVERARTPFEGWGGFSVPELTTRASQYIADQNEDTEQFLKELLERRAKRLPLRDMAWLISACRVAGFDLPKFDPGFDRDDYED